MLTQILIGVLIFLVGLIAGVKGKHYIVDFLRNEWPKKKTRK